MTADPPTATAPNSLTLSATGAGSATFRNGRIVADFVVRKITVTCATPAGGTARLFRDGTFLTASPFATYTVARGEELLQCGQELRLDIQGGPPLAQVTVTFHYEERALDVA